VHLAICGSLLGDFAEDGCASGRVPGLVVRLASVLRVVEDALGRLFHGVELGHDCCFVCASPPGRPVALHSGG